MHKVTFHNIGNADCIRIDLENGRKLLFDYAHMGDSNGEDDVCCDLPKELRDDLGDREAFDVVAFTHLDNDHYAGATDFFYFEHIKKYQADVDGELRIKMNEMWVPAAVITETLRADADAEAKAIQKEARERFKAKAGIRVFSAPRRLRDWCERNDVDFDERKHFVTDAGTLVPSSVAEVGVEFFVHSPFAMRQDECTVEDRNNDALVLHATFKMGGRETKLFLASDVEHDVLTDIITVTERKKNGCRLEWDIFKLPHHCSHHSLSGAPREGDKSVPEPKVKRLFEEYSQDNCIVVSTSEPIPAKGTERDKKGANPPHRQAAAYYRENVVADDGDFKVTMEHPSESDPSPLVIHIDGHGATVKKARAAAAFVATTSRAPRAG
jgi:hypothetical protein